MTPATAEMLAYRCDRCAAWKRQATQRASVKPVGTKGNQVAGMRAIARGGVGRPRPFSWGLAAMWFEAISRREGVARMASTVSGIKTGMPTTAGTPARVVSGIAAGMPKRVAIAKAGKPRSDVRV